MRLRTARRWLPRAGLAYLVAAFLSTAAPGFEVFPFFCWFLFPIVPGYEPTYELVVTEHGGRVVEPPRDVQTLGLVRDPAAMDLWLATQNLGRALARDDAGSVERLRRLIEDNFVCAPSRYAIERVRFDPVERFRTGAVAERRVLATFESPTGCRSRPWPTK